MKLDATSSLVDVAFAVEFPPGPLMIGEDAITRWNTDHRNGELLHVLNPTDSCRDRLAAFLFWNDFSGLEQALAVSRAQSTRVDLDLVRDWCKREGGLDKYALFHKRLGEA